MLFLFNLTFEIVWACLYEVTLDGHILVVVPHVAVEVIKVDQFATIDAFSSFSSIGIFMKCLHVDL
jgi:hypothetical protein